MGIELGFQILFEDDAMLAVVKPAGVLTQAPPGIDSLEFRIKHYLKVHDTTADHIYLGVPHRLDRPVSGAMVFAKHSRAARRIAKQFERRNVVKIYWACTAGGVEPEQGTWTDYLRKIPGEPRAQIVDSSHSEGRIAVLHYRTLGITSHGSWLEVRLETGRTHQVRVQAAARGTPLLGDEFYGATVAFGTPHADERLRSVALHARSLTLEHPMSRERLTFTAGLGEAWTALDLPEWTRGPRQDESIKI